MSQLISRRRMLSGAVKTTAGFVVFNQLNSSIFALSRLAQESSNQFKTVYERLDEYVGRHMAEMGLPGLTLAIANRQGLLRTSQYGFADVKAGIKVAPETLFEIGSISKSFVAMAVLQLVEEGKLDLHKPVTDYLPWLKIESSYAPFTTHHLLSHTAGLSGIPLLLRVAFTPLRVGTEPGTHWVYSNIGYDLLGLLIETLDKRPFADAIRERVFKPLAMNSSSAVISNAIRERIAVGYGPLKPDRPFPLRGKLAEAPWVEVAEAAGSITATPADMGNYLQMLLNRGMGVKGRVLSEKSFDLLTKPVIKSSFRGEDASYAYGLWVSDINQHTLLRHTGGMVAFSSAMFADVTDGLAAFASVNAARLPGGYRPVPVVRYALALLSAASQNKDLPPAPQPIPSPTVVRNAADYAGTFVSPDDGAKLVLIKEGDKLLLEHAGARIVLEQVGRDVFIVQHPDFELFPLVFERDKEQVVEAFNGANWWINERYTGAKKFDYPKEWDAFTGHFHSDSPWYGSTRVVIRKGQLLVGGDTPLAQVAPNVFRPADDPSDADRVIFDMFGNGKATRLTFSGVEFFRAFTA